MHSGTALQDHQAYSRERLADHRAVPVILLTIGLADPPTKKKGRAKARPFDSLRRGRLAVLGRQHAAGIVLVSGLVARRTGHNGDVLASDLVEHLALFRTRIRIERAV